MPQLSHDMESLTWRQYLSSLFLTSIIRDSFFSSWLKRWGGGLFPTFASPFVFWLLAAGLDLPLRQEDQEGVQRGKQEDEDTEQVIKIIVTQIVIY